MNKYSMMRKKNLLIFNPAQYLLTLSQVKINYQNSFLSYSYDLILDTSRSSSPMIVQKERLKLISHSSRLKENDGDDVRQKTTSQQFATVCRTFFII